MIDVAIVGASGYAARELFRILLGHPEARVTMATSRSDEGTRVDSLHPSLASRINLTCEPFDADKLAANASLAFLGLPHTASFAVTPALRQRGVKVIDLSADYRLKDANVYADWYGHAQPDAQGLREAIYGLPELFRSSIASAGLIANPGCYTSASILGLAPLVTHNLVERQGIIIDAKSGITGGGRAPKPMFHYPEANENVTAYSVGRHRHTPEIDQVLSEVGLATSRNDPVEVVFTPHLMPMDRGIHATIYANPKGTAVEHDLLELYRAFYKDSPFVRITANPPSTKDSTGTNFCDITVRVVRGKVVILSCLDNLLKGASGVAVQNFNLMHGFGETTGLWV